MKRVFLFEFVFVALILISGTTMIAWSGADLAVSTPFFQDGQWPIGDQFLWHLLYKLDRIPSGGLGLTGLGLCLASWYRQDLRHWRRAGAFLAILLILAPGLLVNTIFKDHWGRPRPREVTQFGGTKQFLQPWQKGVDGHGRSFPSGHASAAFYMGAPYFIYRRRNRKLARIWLAGGMVFGLLMSVARITQGAHFLSDNLWAWGMVTLVALVLAQLLGLDRETPVMREDQGRQCST